MGRRRGGPDLPRACPAYYTRSGEIRGLKRQSTSGFDSQTADADDDEDDDSSTPDTTAAPEKNVVTATAQPLPVQPEPKKTVIKTAQSKPVFSPVVIPFRKDGEPVQEPAKQRPRIVKNEK
jgi:hypothetical protein